VNTRKLNKEHYPALDGLRGVAILLVVLFHNFGFIKQSYFGWLGVDLFFVLSGFLITTILINEVGKQDYLKNFYIRRVLRIFPLYFLCLTIFLIIIPALGLYKEELTYFIKNQWWLWTYLQNWLYSFHLTSDAKMLTHLWSLAVEEQFYLVWPFIILVIKSPRKLFFIMLTVLVLVIATRSIIWLCRIEDLNYTTLYTFTRIDGICIGSMVALLMRVKPYLITKNMAAIVLVLAAMNFIFYLINKSDGNNYPYFAFVGYTTFCAMFGLLVHEIVTSNKTTITNKIFSVSPLRFFGKISYGFYVFHWPVYLMTQQYFFNYLQNNLQLSGAYSRIGASILSTGLAFLISIISYYYFERYFLRLKDKFK
jgi:peptidoglycan/LPS O-acetylase OafA/YrhL